MGSHDIPVIQLERRAVNPAQYRAPILALFIPCDMTVTPAD